MPELDKDIINRNIDRINTALSVEDYYTAKALLKDLVLTLNSVIDKLSNWEKLDHD